MFVRRSELESIRDTVDEIAEQSGASERWFESVLRKRIILHTLKGELTIDGVLWATTEDGIVLRAAKVINDGAPPTSLAGEVFVPAGNVAFVQLDE